jgi:hypothetical protein
MIILRARTFFASSLTAGPRSSYRIPSWRIFQIRRHSRWAIAPIAWACPSRGTSRRYTMAKIVPLAFTGVGGLIEDPPHLSVALGAIVRHPESPVCGRRRHDWIARAQGEGSRTWGSLLRASDAPASSTAPMPPTRVASTARSIPSRLPRPHVQPASRRANSKGWPLSLNE